MKLTTGQDFTLSSLRGKVVAVEFVYTTCPHCQHLAGTTSKLVTEYGPRGFRAVAIAFNENAERLAPEFAKAYAANFPVGIGTNETMFGFAGPPTRAFRLPVLLFVDRKQMIRAQFTGEDSFFEDEETNLRKWVEQLLGEREPETRSPAPRKRSR